MFNNSLKHGQIAGWWHTCQRPAIWVQLRNMVLVYPCHWQSNPHNSTSAMMLLRFVYTSITNVMCHILVRKMYQLDANNFIMILSHKW